MIVRATFRARRCDTHEAGGEATFSGRRLRNVRRGQGQQCGGVQAARPVGAPTKHGTCTECGSDRSGVSRYVHTV